MLAEKEKIMGFGHRVYKSCDPRSDIIQVWARKLCEATDLMLLYDISERIESGHAPGKEDVPQSRFLQHFHVP
jgi:2-methylcitrate synthase